MHDKSREHSSMSDGEARLNAQGRNQGRINAAPPPGTTESHDRATFNDPVPGNIDPTAPASPEQTMPFEKDRTLQDPHVPDLTPQQNAEPSRIVDTHTGKSEDRH